MNDNNEKKSSKLKEFRLTTVSVNNRKTVFLIAALILIAGLSAYVNMPKESFPELTIPEIYVGTPYPGGSPEFVEDKITEPFEKEFNSIKDVKEITSTSIYGYSSIKIEFDFSVSIEEGRRKVQDAIADARAKPEFPALDFEPTIREVDFSEMPIMTITKKVFISVLPQENPCLALLTNLIREQVGPVSPNPSKKALSNGHQTIAWEW